MKKGVVAVLLSLITICSTAISIASLSFAWFKKPGGNINEEIMDGQIALRGYFFSGNGSEEAPYEIVTPTHLYNLSRLQNLGVFPTTAHFRIGHDFDPDDDHTNYQCLDDSGNRVDVLDMDSFLSGNPSLVIRPIGSESTPFRGVFKGNGIPIKNLVISGYPEDIGVFGYVSYDGVIEGLVCSDLEVRSLGYTKAETQPDIYNLYSPNIDDIFDDAAHYLASQTSLSFYEKVGSNYVEHSLKNINVAGGTEISDIDTAVIQVPVGVDADDSNHDDRFISGSGYFLPTFPEVLGDRFTYSWASSSTLIKETDALEVDVNGDGKNDSVIAFDLNLLKYAGSGENQFNNTELNMEVGARLSLIASVTVDGVVYSRVIQSYGIEFYSNNHVYGDGYITANIFCNYLAPADPNHPDTNYHHGNNIGFLVGHLDGSLDNSYVYHGKFVFNDDSDYHPIITETNTGLVGEVGTSVINSLDPDFNSTVRGEIGVMNFTGIYNGIRKDFVGGETAYSGTESSRKFVAYDGTDSGGNSIINYGPTSLFSLYEPYLRHTESGHYITPVDGNVSGSTWGTTTVPTSASALEKFNTVDFLFNQLIEDERDGEGNLTVDRGLGVFKIATPRNAGADGKAYGLVWDYNWGDCRIFSGTPKSKVYFSTAEYNHTYSGYNPSWGITTSEVDPIRATTLPSYSDVFTFDYPFSRDYNYVFELDLAQNSASNKNSYMYNTDSTFLTNYLTSILKNKNGEAITHGNYRFGFMFRSSENVALNSLSSYMELDQPGRTVNYGDGTYYPSNSIIFRIENDRGANISVVGNERNISIYKFSTTSANDPVELYTMYCENILESDPRYVDSHRYFRYDFSPAANGATDTTCVPYSDSDMGDGDNALYAHIFHLPQSEEGYMYAIGRSKSSSGFAVSYDSGKKAKLYYLAVQGQTSGTIDTNKIADVGNHLNDVDFLVSEPTKSDYTSVAGYTPKRAFVNFSANFNTTDGELDISTKTVSETNYLLFEYVNDPQFITAMTAYDFKTVHGFYVNSEGTKRESSTVPIV